MTDSKTIYNRAKIWQMAFFVMNNLATNAFLGFMLYITYYAVGVAGLAVVAVSFILTAMRMFDGITDPIIGFFIDQNDTKFGKFRPAMLLGYVIMVIATTIMINTVYLVPETFRLIYFVFIYSIYIIGYTFQCTCTKAGQACLTNDPTQRPTFSLYDGIYNTIYFAFLPWYVLNYLVPKHTIGDLNGLNNVALHQELLLFTIVFSGILTCLAIIGISQKDRKEFFGLGTEVKVTFKDYGEVLKNNRAIQMLIFAASTDKLANSTMGNVSVGIIVFAIASGSSTIQGQILALTSIPSLIVLAIGIKYAANFGQKQAIVVSTWMCLAFAVVLASLILFGPMPSLSISSLNVFSITFIGIYILLLGVRNISSSIAIPMIADCADYETFRSGRYIPGMMGTLFSLVDKLISAFAATVVGLALAMIGFTTTLPTAQTPLTSELLYIGVFLFLGMPILGWICSLIAMKFYPLTQEKMIEIQAEIQRIKESAKV